VTAGSTRAVLVPEELPAGVPVIWLVAEHARLALHTTGKLVNLPLALPSW
jgi:hypothetical protein